MADIPSPSPTGVSSTVEIKRLPHIIKRDEKTAQIRADDWSRSRRSEAIQAVKDIMQSQITAGQDPMATKQAIELATAFKEFLRPNGRQEPENAPGGPQGTATETNI